MKIQCFAVEVRHFGSKLKLPALISLILGVSTLIGLSSAEAQATSPRRGTAQERQQERQAELDELKARVSKLEAQQAEAQSERSPEADDLTKLRLELQLPESLGATFTGLAPGVSKVYSSRSPLAVGGFGEIHYSSEQRGNRVTNITRFNPRIGYRFSRQLIFNSGLSFENGGATEGVTALAKPDDRGRAGIEFAYLDYLVDDEAGVRLGNFVVPFGLINLRYEPNLFPMVRRPRPEVTIIPSTWHENGILGFGKVGSVMIQAAAVNSPRASNFEEATWIRAGRQNGANAIAKDPSYVLRAEHVGEDESLGGSMYLGDSSQGDLGLGRSQIFMGEVHAEWRMHRFSGKALYVEGSLSDTEKLAARGTVSDPRNIGSRVRGHYLILSYDLLPRIAPIGRALVQDESAPPGPRELPFFISWEQDNVEVKRAENTAGITGPTLTNVLTTGLNYKPHPQVVIKADFAYEYDNRDRIDRIFETGIGFVF